MTICEILLNELVSRLLLIFLLIFQQLRFLSRLGWSIGQKGIARGIVLAESGIAFLVLRHAEWGRGSDIFLNWLSNRSLDSLGFGLCGRA